MNLVISKDFFIDGKKIVIEPSEDGIYRVEGIMVAHKYEDGDLHIALEWLEKAINKLEAGGEKINETIFFSRKEHLKPSKSHNLSMTQEKKEWSRIWFFEKESFRSIEREGGCWNYWNLQMN